MTTPADELRHAAAHLRITAIGATDDTGTDTWTTRRTSPTGTTSDRHTLSVGPGKRLIHSTAPGPTPWAPATSANTSPSCPRRQASPSPTGWSRPFERRTAGSRSRLKPSPFGPHHQRTAAMSRLSRPLCAAYGALTVWLAYCAVQTARSGAPWLTTVFVIASPPVAAVIREGELDEALRREAVRAERAAHTGRRALAFEQELADAIDQVAVIALAEACCEPWWTSCGFHHDPSCRNSSQSSAA